MDRSEDDSVWSGETAPAESWLFAQAILGRLIPRIVSPEARARAKREELERLAQFSPRHAEELRRLKATEAEARHDREVLEWAAKISTHAEEKLQAFQREEAEERKTWRRTKQYSEELRNDQQRDCDLRQPPTTLSSTDLDEITEWNPDQQRVPAGSPQGGQWTKGGGGFLGNVIRRNQMAGDLTGVVTPSMAGSSRLASQLQATARLPAEVTSAAAAGLATGGKAIVNGAATAVKNVATLGLSSSQLELIGVTKEDRERGYDTAVSIATASGQVLIAVGTSGLATALSKGGTVARTASGALVAFDAAGNAVGTVQGADDASQNGLNLENGLKIAGGALGLAANAKAARQLGQATNAAQLERVEAYIAKCPRKPTPAKSPANQYEIAHTGPHNYTISGGGADFEIDGYQGTKILEAKHAGDLKSSPYIPGSSCPDEVRGSILSKTRKEFEKMRTIIRSGETPFKAVEIITNTPESKVLFVRMLKESGVPGMVRLAI